jgi:hypothetical protein
MTKLGAILSACAALALGSACGGKSFDGIDGGGDADGGGRAGDDAGGGGGDGGRTCDPLPGCDSRTSCPAGDGCNSCTCIDGHWGCSLLGCPVDAGPPTCPASMPGFGTYCPTNGLGCNYSPSRCGISCTCVKNQWECVAPPCPAPTCPPSPPAGTCDGELGLRCNYGSSCNQTQCECVSTSQGDVWECLGTGCTDAGHSNADGGH